MQVQSSLNSLIIHPESEKKANFTRQLPQELIQLIFSFLADLELVPCSRVCKQWHQLTKESAFWERRIGKGKLENLTFLKEKAGLSWIEANKYEQLSTFLHSLGTEASIKKKFPHEGTFLKPILKRGNLTFSVQLSTNVEIKKQGDLPVYLIGEAGKKVLALALEENHLFTLRNDGLIVQWNCQTGRQVKTIATAKRSVSIDPFCFHVQEGLIVIKYGKSESHLLELISLADASKSEVIEDLSIPSPRKVIVKGNLLLLLGINNLFFYNLKTKEKGTLDKANLNLGLTEFFWDMALAEDKLFISASNNTINEINVNTKKLIKSYNFPSPLKIEAANDLIFGAQEDRMYILNLSNEILSQEIKPIYEDEEINAGALKELMTTIKKLKKKKKKRCLLV